MLLAGAPCVPLEELPDGACSVDVHTRPANVQPRFKRMAWPGMAATAHQQKLNGGPVSAVRVSLTANARAVFGVGIRQRFERELFVAAVVFGPVAHALSNGKHHAIAI